MKLMSSQRFLTIYSGVLTVVFAVTVFDGFSSPAQKSTFDEIYVRRINVVEPDGTLRMVLSDKTRFPGLIVKGKEYPHEDRKTAGILFFDDEGTEDGGLIFGGMKDKDGKVQTLGHLSFDQYMQDQVLTLDAAEENGQRTAGIGIWDRGNYPITDEIGVSTRIQKLPESEQKLEWDKFFAVHPGNAQRVYLGRAGNHGVALRLKDEQGRDRIVLRVNPDGSPVLQLLDANGKEISHLP